MAADESMSFEPDQPSGWNKSELADFLQSVRWQFASTMPANPHEYTLRRDTLAANFEAAVRYIRQHGFVEYYAGKPYKVLYLSGHKYWTMGAALPETVLINRKPWNQDA